MALTAGAPESHSRPLPSVWTSVDAAGTMQEALEALDTYKKKDLTKGKPVGPPKRAGNELNACTVVVRFKAVGNAPIMKQNFYKISASNRFQAVIQFLRKELGWKAGDPLVSPHRNSASTSS